MSEQSRIVPVYALVAGIGLARVTAIVSGSPPRCRFRQAVAVGGRWESWTSPQGEVLRIFCVLTTGPNEIMAPIHDRNRMPVIVAPEHWAAWLNPLAADLATLLLSYPSGSMEAWPVSRRASDARQEGPELLARNA